MFPFKLRSLTKSIDDEIHQAVWQQAPGKYFTLRCSALLARIGFATGMLAVALYCIMSFIARTHGDLPKAEVDELVQAFAYVITSGVALGVISRLFHEIVLKELEIIARSAIPRILAK